MSQPFASIGGIASGLDTASIVQQLMQLERQPMVLLQQRKAQYQKVDDAWGTVVTRLSTLRTSTNNLTDPNWLAKTSAASASNSAVATAKVTGAAQTGSISFNVTKVAQAHQVAIGGTFLTADAVVGAGELTIERNDGTTVSVTLGEGATLNDAARALNDKAGISARVLKTADDEYRLIVTADKSGHGAAFKEVEGFGALTGVTDLRVGQDAELDLGGGIIVKRATNTITDLVDGVEVRIVGQGEVTVDVNRDLDAAVEKVNGFVTALNGLLNQLNTVGKTSPDAGGRGPLAGDPLVRSLQMQLRGALSQVVGDGEFQTLSQIGIQLTRTGSVTLDQTKLREALSSNPAEVASLLGKASNASDPRVEVTAAGRAQAGTYQLQVNTAARIAAVTGATYDPPGENYPKTLKVTVPGRDTPITITLSSAQDSAASAVAAINAQLLAEGITRLKATTADNETRIRFEADRAGPAGNFAVEAGDLDPEDPKSYEQVFGAGFFGTFQGQNANVTVTHGAESWTFDANGRTATMPDGIGRGLIFRVPADVDGDLGEITVGEGLGSLIDRILRTAEGSGGSIARARDAVKGRIDSTNTSIEAFENRLEIRERTIRRQFTALETAMAQMQTQASWLASQLGSMMG